MNLPSALPPKSSTSGRLAAWLAALAVFLSFSRHLIGPVHPADLLILAALLFWAIQLLTENKSLARLPGAAATLLALAALSLHSSPNLNSGLLEFVKFGLYLIGAVLLFSHIAVNHERLLALSIAAATAISASCGLIQYLTVKDPLAVTGFLDSRTLYGACLAAGAPFLLGFLFSFKRSIVWIAAFMLAGALSILSAPMFAIFAGASLFTAWWHGRTVSGDTIPIPAESGHVPRYLHAFVVAGLLGLVLLLAALRWLPRDNRAAWQDSLAAYDREGFVKRKELETQAAMRAIKAQPWLGEGLGSYQRVVSSPRFRDTLPVPMETKVEKGVNSGYLVLAVEAGLPAAFLLFCLLLGAARSAGILPASRAAVSGDTIPAGIGEHAPVSGATIPIPAVSGHVPRYLIAISALALAAASVFAVLFQRGPGILLAAVVGLSYSRRLAECAALESGDTIPIPAESGHVPRFCQFLWNQARSRISWQGGLILVALAIGVRWHGSDELSLSSDQSRHLKAQGERLALLVNPVAYTAIAAPMRQIRRPDAAGKACVGVELGADKPPKIKGFATYLVKIEKSAPYRLWLRAWWSDGCANAFAAAFDGATEHLVGNDGTYHAWHWVSGPVFDLQSGVHTLAVLERKDGVELDQLLLANDDGLIPEGILIAGQKFEDATLKSAQIGLPAKLAEPKKDENQKVAVTEPKKTTFPPPADVPLKAPAGEPKDPEKKNIAQAPGPLKPLPAPAPIAAQKPPVDSKPPVQPQPEKPAAPAKAPAIVPAPVDLAATTAPPAAEKKFLAGVGGCYRDGLEEHLVWLGVPCKRLEVSELTDINKLKDIDFLLMSDDTIKDLGALYRTLYAFIKSGRVALVEVFPYGWAPPNDDPNDLFLQRQVHVWSFDNTCLEADDSKFFKDVPPHVCYNSEVNCQILPLATNVPRAEIHGAISQYGNKLSGALLVRQSKTGGKLYFMAVHAAFATMWRERKIDPFVCNVIRDATAGKCSYPYQQLQFAPANQPRVKLSDDFQREAGAGGQWQKLKGSFTLTGAAKNGEPPFAFRCQGPALSAIGQDNWRDYRPAVSVLLKSGEAGVYYSVAGGGRLELRLKDGGHEVLLVHQTEGGEKILAHAPVEFYSGWRRLALLRRAGLTEGWVDGQLALTVKDAPESSGKAGLCSTSGECHFADFAAIDVSALTAGRDVAPGEESSERCLDRYYQRCAEKLSIYSPQWFCAPDPADPNGVVLRLPLFKGGLFQIDDKPPVEIPAGTDFARLPLPGSGPRFDISVHTPLWRDYHFCARVTDWYAGSGLWDQGRRWACDPSYQWFGGNAERDGVLWYKPEIKGNFAAEVMLAPNSDSWYGDDETGRDLNLVVFGDGQDLSKGYQFIALNSSAGCQIKRGSQLLASTTEIGVPSRHAAHHTWFSVAAVVTGSKLRMYFDRRLILEVDNPDPLTSGKFGIWTRQNKISVARATLSLGN
jgi:hypothetical protein